MSVRTSRARHRAARPSISTLTQSVSADVGRRAAVVAAAGGIIASSIGGAATAQAQPVSHDNGERAGTDLGGLSGLSELSAQARAAVRAAPAVTVSAEATVAVEKTSVEITPAPPPPPKPKPKPEPAPEPEPAETETAETKTAESTEPPAPQAEEPAPTEEPADASSSDIGAAAVEIAKRYVGVPYVYGGESPSGFDCSGLVVYVYRQVGIELPHQSTAIRDSPRTTVISAAEARPGDLLWTPGHVGIYIGNGKQIDASRPDGWNVAVRDIWQTNPTYLRVS